MDDFLKGEETIFEDFIFEMATIAPKDHKLGVDLKMHIYQPGEKKLSHGPRVKFFKHTKGDSFSISVSKEPNRINLVAGKIDGLITESELNALVQKIRKYRIPLLNMWRDPGMSQEELIDQMRDVDAGRPVEIGEKANFA